MQPLLKISGLLLVIGLLAVGCRRESVEARRVIADASGTNELVLYDVVSRSGLSDREEYGFHSLAWRIKEGTGWTNKWVISQSAFQGFSPQRKWVVDIARFDSTNGTAV